VTDPAAPVKRQRVSRAKSKEHRLLIRAITELPTETRDVFVLHRMAGLPYDQIAEVLGIDRERVQAQLAGALVQISETLNAAED